jgi:hypothetical protein
MLLLCLIAGKSRDPDKLIFWFGLSGLLVGILVCGFLSGRMGDGWLGAVESASLYAFPLLLLSILLGKESSLAVGTRTFIYLACFSMIFLLSFVSKKSIRKNKKSGKRKKDVFRYLE